MAQNKIIIERRKMKRLCLTLILVILMATVASLGCKKSSDKAKASSPAAQEILTISGKILKIDTTKAWIIVSGQKGSSSTLAVGKNTVIYKSGKAIKLSDLKVGNSVTITYESKKGTNIAKTIQLEPAKTKKR